MDKEVKVKSIDRDILHMIKDHQAYIYAIHKNSVHICVCNTLITVGDLIPEGKHHVVISQNIIFNSLGLKINQLIYIIDKNLYIGDMQLMIDDIAIKDYQSYDFTYVKTIKLNDSINQLLIIIDKNVHEEMFLKYNTRILKIVTNRVNQFLKIPILENAQLILGLGQGLTPYGDDILVGYIMGRNTIGYPIEWIENLIDFVDEKTTKLSAQNIKDTKDRIYPYIYVEMIEELFNENKIEHAIELMKIGDTSGVGMLLGFLHGIKAGDEDNERF
ncbi:MAG: DUF2877 domain-containing protein [Acholeplasmataceae bacterium]